MTSGDHVSSKQALVNYKSLFLFSCVAILLITAIAKFITFFFPSSALQGLDEIVPVPKSFLLAGTALLEVIVTFIVILKRPSKITFFAIAWLSSVFLSYRVARYVSGATYSCPCLGILSSVLPITAYGAGIIATLLAVYMFFGSIFALLDEK